MQITSIRQIVEDLGFKISAKFNFSASIDKVIIDSRKTKTNTLFVAIKGDKKDGHDYVKSIVVDNACFALVNKDFKEDLPNLIYVDDTVKALGALAKYYRDEFSISVVAITGSNGKTTVKEMLKNVLMVRYGSDAVLATEGNLNNHLGMPLTLLEMSDNHKVAVIEMGMNHSGELDYLSKLASPSHAVVNNVLFAHAGHFNGLEDIAKAKGEIYHGLANDGLACVDMSSEFAKMWLENDIKIKNIFEFGRAESKCYIKNIDIDSATYVTPLGELQVSLKVLGKHNYINALTVIALAVNLGCSLADIKNGLEGYTGYKGRLERKVAFNDAIIIDDTYNANPDSVKAALSAIQIFNQEKWFIFADLKELGADEENIHINLTKDIQQNNINKLITVGKLAKLTSDNFRGDKLHFETNDDVVKYCMSHLPNNVVLLVKGSNSMRLFDIVNQIVKK